MPRKATPLKRRWRAIGAVAAAALILSAQPSVADEYFYPGLPENDGTTGDGWINAGQSGLGYSTLAKQWFRTPVQMAAARTQVVFSGPKPGADNTIRQDFVISAQAFLVSPGSAPENYGYLETATVRSVGFGLMPVEATIQVSQRRKDGKPIPIEVKLHAVNISKEINSVTTVLKEQYQDTVVEDAFNIQILDIKIDGVDINLTGNCRTITPAPVRMVGPGYTIDLPDKTPSTKSEWYASHDVKDYYNPFNGGYMSGNITIPPFTGCTTQAGDDLSALMTKSASGPDNPVSATSSYPCQLTVGAATYPAAPGKSTPKKAGCYGLKPLEYPDRPAD